MIIQGVDDEAPDLHKHVADLQQASLGCGVERTAPVLRVSLVGWVYAVHWHTHTMDELVSH